MFEFSARLLVESSQYEDNYSASLSSSISHTWHTTNHALRLIIQQNITIFLGVDYAILGNQRMLKQQQ